jgi:phosphatidyl-myo-inositol dimannoside synthase
MLWKALADYKNAHRAPRTCICQPFVGRTTVSLEQMKERASPHYASAVRVLMATHTYPRYPGDGTAPFLDTIVRGLVACGHSIDVVLPYHPEFRFADEDGLRFHPFRYSPAERWSPWGYGQSLRGDATIPPGVVALAPAIVLALRRKVRQLLREGTHDLVHAHWAVPNGSLVAGVARRYDVPVLVSLYGTDVSVAERYGVLRRAAAAAFAGARAITACSDNLRRRAEALGADPHRIETIRHGVDADGFNPGLADEGLRQSLLTDRKDDMLVVAAGRLVEVKGFEYLVEAAAKVTGIRVAIIGEGELRPALERRASELGAPVTFLGNLPYHHQVAETMASADIVVVPSVVDGAGRVDGLPSTVLEALASGRPVVATRIGGIPEVIADGTNGLLVHERDPVALASALERLRDNPAERLRLGEEARRSALAVLSWDTTIARFDACYARLAGATP